MRTTIKQDQLLQDDLEYSFTREKRAALRKHTRELLDFVHNPAIYPRTQLVQLSGLETTLSLSEINNKYRQSLDELEFCEVVSKETKLDTDVIIANENNFYIFLTIYSQFISRLFLYLLDNYIELSSIKLSEDVQTLIKEYNQFYAENREVDSDDEYVVPSTSSENVEQTEHKDEYTFRTDSDLSRASVDEDYSESVICYTDSSMCEGEAECSNAGSDSSDHDDSEESEKDAKLYKLELTLSEILHASSDFSFCFQVSSDTTKDIGQTITPHLVPKQISFSLDSSLGFSSSTSALFKRQSALPRAPYNSLSESVSEETSIIFKKFSIADSSSIIDTSSETKPTI